MSRKSLATSTAFILSAVAFMGGFVAPEEQTLDIVTVMVLEEQD